MIVIAGSSGILRVIGITGMSGNPGMIGNPCTFGFPGMISIHGTSGMPCLYEMLEYVICLEFQERLEYLT